MIIMRIVTHVAILPVYAAEESSDMDDAAAGIKRRCPAPSLGYRGLRSVRSCFGNSQSLSLAIVEEIHCTFMQGVCRDEFTPDLSSCNPTLRLVTSLVTVDGMDGRSERRVAIGSTRVETPCVGVLQRLKLGNRTRHHASALPNARRGAGLALQRGGGAHRRSQARFMSIEHSRQLLSRCHAPQVGSQ